MFAAVIGLIVAAAPFDLTAHIEARQSQTVLEELYWRVATPHDLEYAQFRSPDDLAQLVGGTDEAVAEASAWLLGLNGKNIRVSGLRDTITATFSGAEPALFSKEWSENGLPAREGQPSGVAFVIRRDVKPASIGPTTLPPRFRTNALASRSRGAYSVSNQKTAYKIPADTAATNPKTMQMVWGPGTFGYSPDGLAEFKQEECPGINLDKVKFDTSAHGQPGGDNFGEGTLDTHMISSFGMNATTIVSNTNTSSSTEEGEGFGLAFLDFVTELAARPVVPHVLSLSLGSLSAYSCDLLCDKAAATGKVELGKCREYLQRQRQVCMFMSVEQVAKINTGLMALGLRGVSIFASSGDGGSHWSFGRFQGWGAIPRVLNEIGCQYQFPIFPSPSPYVVSVGGTDWRAGDSSQPTMWPGSGGGFSWTFERPSHQDAAVSSYLQTTPGLPPSTSFNSSNRAYPDISAVAVEGTSQSSPTFAGIFTLLVDARLNAGLKPLGALGPRIWQVAQSHPGEAFEDVTTGNSRTSCSNGFPAAKGWDPTTGWGRPVWPGLLKYFGSDQHL